MRSTRPIQMKKPVRGNKSRHVDKSKGVPWWAGGPATAGAVIGLMIIAVVVAVYEPIDRTSLASVHTDAASPQSDQSKAAADPRVGHGADTLVGSYAIGNASKTSAAVMPASETAADPISSPVTITGCLERSDEAFRLKDTVGQQAPRARNWRSGFLKKASASVEVVAAANRVNLSNHVGERVSVTGTLIDREMHARSLQRVAASCGGTGKVRT
jgi:hypothetical protein